MAPNSTKKEFGKETKAHRVRPVGFRYIDLTSLRVKRQLPVLLVHDDRGPLGELAAEEGVR